MKAAAFEYVRPTGLAEVCEHLAEGDAMARIIAGGQTLVPMMALRLARPGTLVDINRVAVLSGFSAGRNGLHVRACTRQAALLASPEAARAAPLLVKALRFVGHPPTRNRGTVGGSLAHADPAAEIPLVAVALDAIVSLARAGGAREVASRDFFRSAMETSLEDDECLTGVRFPARTGAGTRGTGFQELSLRRGDFAIVAVAVEVWRDGDGTCRHAALAVGGAGPMPARIEGAEHALVGSRLEAGAVSAAAEAAAREVDAHTDPLVSADYRRRVTRALAARAVEEARAESDPETGP